VPPADRQSLADGYEHSDAQPRVVIGGIVGLLVVLALVLASITVLQAVATATPPTIGVPQDLVQGLRYAPPTPPAPRLEAQPGETFGPYREASEQALESYHWVDRANGVVAIPIEQAMDLVVQQGLPARSAPP
jgi:hypothetical protein